MQSSNSYTYFFVITMAVISALLLSMLKINLQERQEFNKALDTKKNVLKTVGLLEPGMSGSEVEELYTTKFTQQTVTDSDGNEREYYIYGSLQSPEGYILPVSGKGVWSTINGFIALEPDKNTVKGISFYDHGETPGLGGEIEKDAFANRFRGKKIFRDGELVSITIAKARLEEESEHAVDGISGASLTTGAINTFLRKNLTDYLQLLR
ncbi:MAG: FMN-binding protein [Chlorobium sp.]|nr:FMN-binding protein [Chlorobium sp.]MCW8815508.1 FMN-binding protein [Chlorobium sp.]MCW8819005.1 FMN-binding protein [Ignavibacteriaceae bacterium]